MGFSLVVLSRGHLSLRLWGLLAAVTPLVAELRLAGFSNCSTRLHYLWCTGLVAVQHVESSQTRDQTHVPCIRKQIFIH